MAAALASGSRVNYMSTNNVSHIIREVTEHAQPIPTREQLITIDNRSGQAVAHTTFLESFTSNYRYFMVANNSDPNKVMRGTKRVKYKEGQDEIYLTISFVGGCQAGQEWWLAQCFFKATWSGSTISDSLATWLFEYFSQASLGIDAFSTEGAKAEAVLATQAGQKFGLDLNVTIKLEGTEDLENTNVGPLVVSSRLIDAEQVDISLTAELEPDQTNLPRFLLSRNKSVDDFLIKGLRDFSAKNVPLETYFHELGTPHVTQLVTDYFNVCLRSVGRRVRYLLLKPEEQPPLSFKSETELDYLHHDYPDPIRIRLSGLMIPTNPALYRNRNFPDLRDWWDQNLRETVDRVLFGVSYVDLLLDFPKYKVQIDHEMSRRAEKMGYSIGQLITALFPNLDALLKGFELSSAAASNSSNGHHNETMFDTSLSNFQVGLEVFLTARVKDLRGIAQYLTSKPDVPARMKQEMLRVVRAFLHGTDPERFYMRFSHRDEQNFPGEKSVEEELTARIQQMFLKDFNAEVLDIVLKPMQTALTKRLASISRASQDFNVGVELGSLPGAPTIFIKGSFKVDGVSPDGWKAFSDSECDVESVKRRTETTLRARLKGEHIDRMILEHAVIKELIEDALRAAQTLIKDEFGLVIRLTTVYWEWDEQLKQLRRQQNKQELATVQQKIQKLKELLLELHENNASVEHIKSVVDRIRRLGATLPPAFASSVGLIQNGKAPAAELKSVELDEPEN
jgi:hypothetical protein